MSRCDKVEDYIERKTADGASFFEFQDICGFNFSHELDMKNHFEYIVLDITEVLG